MPFVAIQISVKLLVISPEDHDERELPALSRLFAAGLAHYHLRKPAWERARLAAFLHSLPADFHPRIILHTHHDLAADFALGGLHFSDSATGRAGPLGPPRMSTMLQMQSGAPSGRALPAILTSRACHDLDSLRAAFGRVSRVLLSPVFPSLSKPGHAPDARLPHATVALTLANRSPAERRTEVVALGGIDASRLAACRGLGFDAVAVLGAVWLRPDPVTAFNELLAHAR